MSILVRFIISPEIDEKKNVSNEEKNMICNVFRWLMIVQRLLTIAYCIIILMELGFTFDSTSGTRYQNKMTRDFVVGFSWVILILMGIVLMILLPVLLMLIPFLLFLLPLIVLGFYPAAIALLIVLNKDLVSPTARKAVIVMTYILLFASVITPFPSMSLSMEQQLPISSSPKKKKMTRKKRAKKSSNSAVM